MGWDFHDVTSWVRLKTILAFLLLNLAQSSGEVLEENHEKFFSKNENMSFFLSLTEWEVEDLRMEGMRWAQKIFMWGKNRSENNFLSYESHILYISMCNWSTLLATQSVNLSLNPPTVVHTSMNKQIKEMTVGLAKWIIEWSALSCNISLVVAKLSPPAFVVC